MGSINSKGKVMSLAELDKLAQTKMPSGNRNNHLKKMVARLAFDGFSIEDTVARVIAEDQRLFNQPLFSDVAEFNGVDIFENARTFVSNIRRSLSLPSIDGTRGALYQIKSVAEILNSDCKVDWLVDDLLTEGGCSCMVGRPKSGKSTLSRQLAKAVARGEEFLGRRCRKGPVLYLALEEQITMIKSQLAVQGMSSDDSIFFQVGPVDDKKLAGLKEEIIKRSLRLVVVDTLYLLVSVRDGNDYQQVNSAITSLRTLARETGCHILCLHHQNKGENKGTNSIHGSSALHGAVDAAIIFNQEGRRRFVSSSQRGGRAFDDEELIFDDDTQSYLLGESKTDIKGRKIKSAIIETLKAAQDGLQTDELLARLYGSSDAKRKALEELFNSGEIFVRGRGVAGDPKIYYVDFSPSNPAIYTEVSGKEVKNGF